MVQSKRGVLKGLHKVPGGQFNYDSLFERDYALYLEAESGVKAWYKDHGIKIPYRLFGLRKSYWPDFLVEYQDGTKELHETKGAGFLSWLTVHLKRRAADEWCRQRGMKYRFIENSHGALFTANNSMDNLETNARGKVYESKDDLIQSNK